MTRITIESLAYGGDGVGRLEDGRAAFVALACPGDVVDIAIREDRERFVRGDIVDIVTPSSDRVTPPCPYFGVCGGCSWQHVRYSAQLAAKRTSVVDALARIGGVADAETVVAAAVPSREPYGYRNKIELVADPAQTRPVLGFHRAGSDEVVPIESCLLLAKRLKKAPKALSGALRYLAGESDLKLRRVGIRAATNTKDVEIALWTEPGAFPRAAAAKTLGQAIHASSIVRVLVKGPDNARKVTGVEVLAGKGNWRERLGGHGFSVSAPSFFQVNTPAAEKLVELALEALEPDGTDRIIDLYAGAGTFTVPLSMYAGEVIAVEAAGSAVRDLRRNLEANETWAEVVGGDAGREIEAIGVFDKVLVDPPRSGLDASIVDVIAGSSASDVVYVSCDPATLARDVKRFVEAGWHLVKATPVDLFPQSYHVETVALLQRRR